MKRKEHELEYSKKEHDVNLEKALDKFSLRLIKVVGAVATIMGLVIIGAFWYWVIKLLFKIGT